MLVLGRLETQDLADLTAYKLLIEVECQTGLALDIARNASRAWMIDYLSSGQQRVAAEAIDYVCLMHARNWRAAQTGACPTPPPRARKSRAAVVETHVAHEAYDTGPVARPAAGPAPRPRSRDAMLQEPVIHRETHPAPEKTNPRAFAPRGAGLANQLLEATKTQLSAA